MSGAGSTHFGRTLATNALQGTIISGGNNAFNFAGSDPACLDENERTGNVHWKVPRRVNTLFTGRTEVLSRIKSAMQGESEHDNVFVITGLGGLGKSEICLRIANETREDFWGVFWLDVSSPDVAKSEFDIAAEMLGKKVDGIEGACRLLANTKKRCLLIIDNADDPSFDYNAYIPPGLKGFIIITSRCVECEMFNTVGYEALSKLGSESCKQVLLAAARIPAKDWKAQEIAAKNVIDLLQAHTLALIQAGTFVAGGFCELKDYPAKYQTQRQRLLEFSPTQARSRYRHVYATFEASDEVLTCEARQMLEVLSMLDNAFIPEVLFQKAWIGAKRASLKPSSEGSDLGDISSWEVSQLCAVTDMSGNQTGLDVLNCWHVAQLPTVFEVNSPEWDAEQLNEAIRQLRSISLIMVTEQDGKRGVSMHPLVHAWAKDRQRTERRQASWLAAGSLIALANLGSAKRENVEQAVRSHVQSWVDDKTKNKVLCCTQRDTVALVWSLSWMLVQMADYSRLDLLLQNLFQDLQLDSVQLQASLLPLYHLIAQTYHLRDKTKLAVELAAIIVERQQATLEQRHPGRLAAEHLLALTYRKHGQIKLAVDLLERSVEVRSELPETNLDRLTCWHELSSAYMANGQIKEALRLLERGVAVEKKVLAEDHLDRLSSQHLLGAAYRRDGQLEKAIALLEGVVELREKVLEPENHSRLASQHELAVAYQLDGQLQKAIALLEGVVELREKVLEPENYLRLVSQHELAVAYRLDGQIKKAIRLLESVVDVEEKLLEPENHLRLVSQKELAVAYRLDGQLQEAVNLLEGVVEIWGNLLEPESLERLYAQHELALAYNSNGQTQEAIGLLKRVVEIENRVLQAGHPGLSVAVKHLAEMYADLAVESSEAVRLSGVPP